MSRRAMKLPAWAAALAGLVVAVAMAGCGTSDGHGSMTSTISTTQLAPSPTTRRSVAVTDPSGYRYDISASSLTAVTSVTTYQGVQLDASPGQVYLRTSVTVRNAQTDRQEPDLGFTDNGAGAFAVAIPKADAHELGSYNFCDLTVSVPACLLAGETQSGQESPVPSDPASPQLAPGAATRVVIFAGPVPSSISASVTRLYFDDGTAAVTLVPTSS